MSILSTAGRTLLTFSMSSTVRAGLVLIRGKTKVRKIMENRVLHPVHDFVDVEVPIFSVRTEFHLVLVWLALFHLFGNR